MAQQQVFDLFRRDLLSAAVDLIFFPSLHGDIAVFIDRDQIARTVEPVGIKGFGIMLRTLVIAAEGVRTTGHQPSDFAPRQRIALRIGHPHFIVRTHWATLSIDNALGAIVEAGIVHQPLRHAEDLLKLTADFRRNTRRERRGQARPANLQQPQRLQAGIAAGILDLLQPQADRRRNQRGQVNLVFFNQREAECGARIVRQYHHTAGEEDA